MKALIFAAGRGERMAELTREIPKPLLEVAGHPLIYYSVGHLAAAGITELVVNLAYLGEQIKEYLGNGSRFGVGIRYSEEPYPLETGGAISRALPLLGDDPFLVVNADVWTDFPFQHLLDYQFGADELGHLVMIPNPVHVPEGDFYLNESSLLQSEKGSNSQPRLTYSGIGLLHPKLVAEYPGRREKFPLGEVFRRAIAKGQLSGEVFAGQWRDIGTPERLLELQQDVVEPD